MIIMLLKKFILKTKMSIDEKIRKLNREDGRKFNKRLIKNLHKPGWCESHKIDYANPDDLKIAREKTYQEMILES